MKINKKTNKKLVVVTASTAVIIIVGVLSFLWMSQSKEKDMQQVKSTQQNSSSKDSTSTKPVESSANTPNPADPATQEKEKEKVVTPSYEGPDVNDKPTLSGSINYSAVSGDTLIIRTTINQTLSGGTCELTLTSGGKKVIKTSNIAQNPSSSTCEGFDVPVSELASGSWTISIKITSGDKSGILAGSAEV